MASPFKDEKMEGWKDGRLKGCWTMNSLGLTQMGHKHIRSHFPPKGNTKHTQIVSSPLAFAAQKEDYRNTLLLQPLWPNIIAFGKLLLATSKMRIAWHQHTLTQGQRNALVCLRCIYGFPNPILFDYNGQLGFNYS